MAVRAMMRVTAIQDINDGKRVTLQPIADADGKYKSYSEWTPCGELWMDITNPAAFGQFESGKLYQIDFTPAEN